MPQYSFARLDNPDVKQDVFYSMKEVPSVGAVVEIDGVKWKRVFTKPRMSVDTKVDCHSASDFVKATNKTNDTMGDLYDRSKEMSLKRIEKDGIDNIKESYYTNYSKRRRGTVHPDKRREAVSKSVAKKGLKIDWGNDD